ncbi:Calcineurin subunit B [Tetrabaena socialis]|uniref:Calcineurin subunit B n=1 Tax=Tetrabaena socialis TaxID=47790 RepID=A0A2J8ABL1_9CHLO|nr:Calcineurin subunit B [Tetrabaena socialis]|eukprot:PNH09909.1 Calcineurin subunit B [Tetrabaena socialis]
MGQGQGKDLGGRLTRKDIERLQRRFIRMASNGSKVQIAAFESMVELGGNPFVPHIFRLFDTSGDGALSLEEFTRALEYFGQLDDLEEQYKFAFRIYDADGDGLISSEELFNVLQALMGSTYPDAQLEQFDRDGDGKLDPEEFKSLLSRTDLANKFSLSL